MEQEVFKVAIHRQGKYFHPDIYWSCINTYKNLCVSYRIGDKTFPKLRHSLLFAFDTFQHAKQFESTNALFSGHILRCAAAVYEISIPYIPGAPRAIVHPSWSKRKISAAGMFWKQYFRNTGTTWVDNMLVPLGTVFCYWILPLERM